MEAFQEFLRNNGEMGGPVCPALRDDENEGGQQQHRQSDRYHDQIRQGPWDHKLQDIQG